jgi:hypothetical protein
VPPSADGAKDETVVVRLWPSSSTPADDAPSAPGTLATANPAPADDAPPAPATVATANPAQAEDDAYRLDHLTTLPVPVEVAFFAPLAGKCPESHPGTEPPVPEPTATGPDPTEYPDQPPDATTPLTNNAAPGAIPELSPGEPMSLGVTVGCLSSSSSPSLLAVTGLMPDNQVTVLVASGAPTDTLVTLVGQFAPATGGGWESVPAGYEDTPDPMLMHIAPTGTIPDSPAPPPTPPTPTPADGETLVPAPTSKTS